MLGRLAGASLFVVISLKGSPLGRVGIPGKPQPQGEEAEGPKAWVVGISVGIQNASPTPHGLCRLLWANLKGGSGGVFMLPLGIPV